MHANTQTCKHTQPEEREAEQNKTNQEDRDRDGQRKEEGEIKETGRKEIEREREERVRCGGSKRTSDLRRIAASRFATTRA